MSPPNQINEWLQRAIVHWLRGQLRMESCPYAIQPMANGSFVVVKVLATSQASLPGRDVKLNSFRGSFATRDEAEREIERLMASRRLTETQRVA